MRGRSGMRDFTQGNILGHLLAFAWPMLVGNLLQALYNTVDAIWVGRYIGANALGAVAVSFPIIMALLALLMGLTMATTTLVAQFRGAKDDSGVKRTISNSLRLLGGLAVVLSVIGFFTRVPILKLISTPEEILPMAASYLGIFLAGVITMFAYNSGSAILRGLGDSQTPLKYLAIATAINMVLDPLLIIGVGPFPQMGIAGAALATVFAQGVSAVLVLRHLQHKVGLFDVADGAKWWHLDRHLTKLTFSIGLPAGFQQFVMSMGMLTITSIINRFGATVTAAFGAAARLDQFAHMPAMSVGMAVSAMVGQNLGAGKDERVKGIVRNAIMVTMSITALLAMIALIFPTTVLSMFTSDAGVLAEGTQYLRIVGWTYVPFAVSFVLTGVLRGAGDTMPTMIITVATLWLVRVPLASYLAGRLGSRGIWLASAITPLMSLSLNYLYYRTGRWRRKVAVRRQAQADAATAAAEHANASEQRIAAGQQPAAVSPQGQ